MSASKDPTTKIRFVYQNLYQLYREDGATWESEEIPAPMGITRDPVRSYPAASSRVLKTGDAERKALIARYQPTKLIPTDGHLSHFRATSQVTLADIQKLSQPLAQTLSAVEQAVEKANLVQQKLRTVIGDLKEFTGKKTSKISFDGE
jgi:hypothetical protein